MFTLKTKLNDKEQMGIISFSKYNRQRVNSLALKNSYKINEENTKFPIDNWTKEMNRQFTKEEK